MAGLAGIAWLLAGCAALPLPSGSGLVLNMEDPQQGALVVYRSTGESPINRPIPARILTDETYVARLLGGEYTVLYLPAGQHELEVEYYRDCELTTSGIARTVVLERGQALYLEVVPGFGGMTWIFCSPFQLVPVPMIGSTVELFPRDEELARKHLGRAVDAELLNTGTATP